MPTTLNPSYQSITQYNLQTGGASNLLNNVAPSATVGVPVISQGSSSQPTFGTMVVGGGGTGITSLTTTWAPICAGTTATGALQEASTGLSTSGNVFASNGASSLPSFQSVGSLGAGWIKITTVTASSSSPTITSGITTTYTNYVVVFDNVIPSVTGQLQIQISSDGGSTYKTSGYLSGYNSVAYNGNTWANANSTSSLAIAATNTAYTSSGCVFLLNLTNTQFPTTTGNATVYSSASNCFAYTLTGGYSTAILVNALKFLNSSGNLTSGNFTLYGLTK